MGNVVKNNTEARAKIAARQDFRNGRASFTGIAVRPGQLAGTVFSQRHGMLPGGSYRRGLDRADYVVYSYSTPIAWHTAEGWYVPPVSYSPTTSSYHMPHVHAATYADMAPDALKHANLHDLGKRGREILHQIRLGHGVEREPGQQVGPLERVVATGEAQWYVPRESIIPTQS